MTLKSGNFFNSGASEDRIASVGFSLQWLRNFRLDKRGPLEDSDVKTRIKWRAAAPHLHPLPSQEQTSHSKIPPVAFGTKGRLGYRPGGLHSGPHPVQPKGNGRHHGLRAGLQSPEANCRQFMCFSPLLHRLPRQAPLRQPSTDAGPQARASLQTFTGRHGVT
jgi:hypothetical protein